jgi:hypothetical protein
LNRGAVGCYKNVAEHNVAFAIIDVSKISRLIRFLSSKQTCIHPLTIIILASSLSTSGATISQPTTTHRRVPNVSSAATAQSSSSSVWLSNSTRHQLEQLMMQGDMIEVTLDETQLLWRVLRACHPSVAESSTPRAKVCQSLMQLGTHCGVG